MYYIPINVISLETVDFTECEIPCSRSPFTLWFSASIITLLWTWWRTCTCSIPNVFLNTQYMRYCDIIHMAPYKICTKNLICFKMKHTNPTPKHKHIFLMQLEWFSTLDLAQCLCTHRNIVLFKRCFSLVNKRWTVDPRYLFQSFLIMWEEYIINSSL